MASITREVLIRAQPETVWAALRDVGAIHTRLAPGFVTDVKLEDGVREVTFGNGMVLRERIVVVDDEHHRVVWAAEGLEHHNASAQVIDQGDGTSRFVWIADLLPNDRAAGVAEMMTQGIAVIKETLEHRGVQQ